MYENIKPPAIPAPDERDLATTARSVRQMKQFLESPRLMADYIQELIRKGYIDVGKE